jgi:hypothetical protein
VNKHQSPKTSNGLKVGDRVIDFRGEDTGVVTAVELNRGPGKSDRVTVLVDGREDWAHCQSSSNYCEVWTKRPIAFGPRHDFVGNPNGRTACEVCGLGSRNGAHV